MRESYARVRARGQVTWPRFEYCVQPQQVANAISPVIAGTSG